MLANRKGCFFQEAGNLSGLMSQDHLLIAVQSESILKGSFIETEGD